MAIITVKVFCLIAQFLSIYKDYCDNNLAINLSDYDYPTPKNESRSESYRVAIFGTNDIHGSAFPLEITHPLNSNLTYKYGGLEYLATYVKILREEWEERFLWLDGGDQFQGALESKISNGSIITEFFNSLKVNGSAIGNHEWDYGKPYLYERLESASWEYLAANIVNNKTNQTEFLPNTKTTKIYQVGKVKIGVIGLSTVETPFTTSGDLTDIKFLEYRDLVINLSNGLRSNGANAVILTTHIGMRCPNDYQEKMILKIRNGATSQAQCEEQDEMSVLLNSLDEGVVDAVVAGHIHDVAHHWVKGVPVIQNINGGYYSHVLYLSFDSKTLKVKKEDFKVEGPLPSCEKIFTNTRRCSYITKTDAADAGDLTTFFFHNKLMKPDSSLDVVFQKWWEAVKPYKANLAYTEETMVRNSNQEVLLGNLVADATRNLTKADIAVINDGSLRSTWFPGEILVEHVWNMFPFDNYLVTFEMTGAELKKMFSVLQGGKKGFYHSSGVMMNCTLSPKALVSIKLYNGEEIDDNRVFKVATNDFMLGGGDDFKDVISWYTPRNKLTDGLVRDGMIKYIKMLGYIKLSDFVDPNRPRLHLLDVTRLRRKLNFQKMLR